LLVAVIESRDIVTIVAAIVGAMALMLTPVVGGLIALNTKTKQINKAVNNRPADEPTIYELAARVESVVTASATSAEVVRTRLDSKDRVDTLRHNENKEAIAEIAATNRAATELVESTIDINRASILRLDKSVKALSARVGEIEAAPRAPRKSTR
jgi:hypothetical protein